MRWDVWCVKPLAWGCLKTPMGSSYDEWLCSVSSNILCNKSLFCVHRFINTSNSHISTDTSITTVTTPSNPVIYVYLREVDYVFSFPFDAFIMFWIFIWVNTFWLFFNSLSSHTTLPHVNSFKSLKSTGHRHVLICITVNVLRAELMAPWKTVSDN